MIRIALIDGPLDAKPDTPATRHAAAVAATILSEAPTARIESHPVFRDRLATSAADLARALEAADADIVHCSLGLPRADATIAQTVAKLIAKGRILVASAPARGAPVWPAALPGVISVQGDARCGPGQWSHLALPAATFGACPRSPRDLAGASFAAAHITGILAAKALTDPAQAAATLRAQATFTGPERRLL